MELTTTKYMHTLKSRIEVGEVKESGITVPAWTIPGVYLEKFGYFRFLRMSDRKSDDGLEDGLDDRLENGLEERPEVVYLNRYKILHFPKSTIEETFSL